jgi:adenosylmethionine-8-amino-7-oxononanoate aminotransferase
MAVGKGLAGGYIPLAATVVARAPGDTILGAHGAFLTGHTYSGHTAACAAALAVQRIIARDSLVRRVRERGAALLTDLRDALARFAEVGDVRGRGYLIGVEFVRDRATREPLPAERAFSQTVGRHAFEDGLIVYPAGDTVIVAPPYNASDAELAELIERLTRATARTLAQR